jgi:hypothetical protein
VARRLWARLKAWVWRRFHHPDATWLYQWPRARKSDEPWTYCLALGHKWGGWRRIGRSRNLAIPGEGAIYTRRCRRRRCSATETVSERQLAARKLAYKGGQLWRTR